MTCTVQVKITDGTLWFIFLNCMLQMDLSASLSQFFWHLESYWNVHENFGYFECLFSDKNLYSLTVELSYFLEQSSRDERVILFYKQQEICRRKGMSNMSIVFVCTKITLGIQRAHVWCAYFRPAQLLPWRTLWRWNSPLLMWVKVPLLNLWREW